MLALARLARTGPAIAMAAVLATGLTTNAQAATGRIRYFNGGQELQITNPRDNVCLALQVRADEVANDTNKSVSVFLGTACATFVTTLAPGRAVSHVGGPQSVRVIG
ncbi:MULTISPECIES: hypothetical protein [Streptomyces]|uniref:hypothetical protein n=1 Tax=Streptomyces TaxID=1883 RepID=UPI00163BCBC7|nr:MULTISPECIES: hypothetical protein [Streptomyces]MBC2874610.1 hypothetical protein [Streptomyces sp. TYQ1024]UBI36625.1 hypothetical protein K7I03_09230 [Streptomyces mobaraensis]UKW29217.1 hypothetical protein MCU78_09210 [Streptomyces sp. TYQ1024]